MTELNTNFAETIKEVAIASMEPRSFGAGQPFVIVPDNCRAEDLEKLMIAPVRKRGQVITSNTESFIAYTKKHGSLDDCTIYADVDSDNSHFKLVGVINQAGARVVKYEHRMRIKWMLEQDRLAALTILMLRGPQTAGEIRSRCGRLHEFATVEALETSLQFLMDKYPPFVARLARGEALVNRLNP